MTTEGKKFQQKSHLLAQSSLSHILKHQSQASISGLKKTIQSSVSEQDIRKGIPRKIQLNKSIISSYHVELLQQFKKINSNFNLMPL